MEHAARVRPPIEEDRVLAARRANLVELLLFRDEVHLVGWLHNRRRLVVLALKRGRRVEHVRWQVEGLLLVDGACRLRQRELDVLGLYLGPVLLVAVVTLKVSGNQSAAACQRTYFWLVVVRVGMVLPLFGVALSAAVASVPLRRSHAVCRRRQHLRHPEKTAVSLEVAVHGLVTGGARRRGDFFSLGHVVLGHRATRRIHSVGQEELIMLLLAEVVGARVALLAGGVLLDGGQRLRLEAGQGRCVLCIRCYQFEVNGGGFGRHILCLRLSINGLKWISFNLNFE